MIYYYVFVNTHKAAQRYVKNADLPNKSKVFYLGAKKEDIICCLLE